jgi:TPR repeat protein
MTGSGHSRHFDRAMGTSASIVIPGTLWNALSALGFRAMEQMILATARTLFQRAAEAGDATAATALAATYDPTVIAKLDVIGIRADLEKARFWYQKAASLGSSDAKRRLDLLANR